MRERKRKNRRIGQRPFDLDIVIPGFGAATGNGSDRFRCSAETRDRTVLQERRAMVADLGRRMMHEVLLARTRGQFSTDELELAYKGGPETLKALCERSRNLLLAPLLERWVASSRIRTKEASRLHVRSFIAFCGGDQAASTSDLVPERIAQWLGSLTDQRHSRSGRKTSENPSGKALYARVRRARIAAGRPLQSVSAATRNRFRASMSAFCSFLVDTAGVLQKHPVRGRVLAEREPRGRLPQVTMDQWQGYLDGLASDALAPRASVLVAQVLRFLGADIGEVLGFSTKQGVRVAGMRASDIIENGSFPLIQFKRQKVDSSDPRSVPCPRFLFQALNDHCRACGVSGSQEVFAFVDRGLFERAHKRARARVGLTNLRIKDLRHLAAITWVRGGIPLTRVQKWLGHSSIQQTAIYADFAPDYSFEGPLVEQAVAASQRQL